MSISTLDNYIAAAKQRVPWMRIAARVTVATGWFSLFDVAGEPGAGTLAVGNTANGIVPVAGVAGFPPINAFGGGAVGYLSRVMFGSNVACRIAVFDCLCAAGAYNFNDNIALDAQPDFSGRIPGGNDYTGLELWAETVTAATGIMAVNIQYTNSDGAPGKTTGAVGVAAAPTLGRSWQLPLAAGDAGVQKIEAVAGSVATAGTFNVRLLRRLWQGRVMAANFTDVHDMLRTGLPQVWPTSALYVLVAADATSSGLPDLSLEIANN